MTKAKIGRPSKLTPAVKTRLFDALKRGAHLDTACNAAGVNYGTVREWVQRGEGTHPRRSQTKEYADFADEITRAIADSEMALLTIIQQSARTDAKHAEWIMERRFPERWANTQRIQVQVEKEVEAELEGLFDSLEANLEPEVYEQVINAIARIQDSAAAASGN